jgi:hypothetical protein
MDWVIARDQPNPNLDWFPAWIESQQNEQALRPRSFNPYPAGIGLD